MGKSGGVRIGSWVNVVLRVIPVLFLALTAMPSESIGQQPQDTGAQRRQQIGQARAWLGRTGLRAFISSSGVLGELQNRAASYGVLEGVEAARTAELGARIAGLEEALRGDLPPTVRQELESDRDRLVTALTTVPEYETEYSAVTVQAGSLLNTGSLGRKPLFGLVRGRGHYRWGGNGQLDVLNGSLDAALVVLPSAKWMVLLGASGRHTSVDIEPFSGESTVSALGPRVDVGFEADRHWTLAFHGFYGWTSSETTINRPGPGGPVEVTTDETSRSAHMQSVLLGRYRLRNLLGMKNRVTLHPLAGFYLVSDRPTGESVNGSESLGVLRVGSTLTAALGRSRRWQPGLLLAYEWEAVNNISNLVDDPHAIAAMLEVSYSLSLTGRALLEYTAVRGLRGRRGSSELTLVLILDTW